MKDLREIDKKEFKKFYEYVKKKTNNFNLLDKSLLDENPQYLLIIRFVLGLSQLEFSKSLGTTNKQWVRHFEAGRQGFKQSKMYEKALDLINKLFLEGKIVDYERTVLLWQRCKGARRKYFIKPPKPKYKMKRFSDMHKEDFVKYFNLLKNETKDFTILNKELIIRDTMFLTIFRMILGLNARELSKLLKWNDTKRLRKYEGYYERMLPETAERIMKILKRKIKSNGINLDNAIKSFERFSPFTNLELIIKNDLLKDGIFVDKNTKKNSNLSGKMQTNVQSIKKEMNIDFVFPDENNPFILIEATRISNKRNRFNITFRIAYLDHRFQLLKLKYPDVKTFIVIKCDEEQRDLVIRTIKRETVNTDFYFVNDFRDLGKKIKELMKLNSRLYSQTLLPRRA